MLAIESSDYRRFEGSNISEQEHVISLMRKKNRS